jgi:hypothetical protein
VCADAAARRRLRAYWLVIKPFSGLIRRELLAAVRDASAAVSELGRLLSKAQSSVCGLEGIPRQERGAR